MQKSLRVRANGVRERAVAATVLFARPGNSQSGVIRGGGGCNSAHVGEPVADEGALAAVAAGGALIEHHVAGLHLHVVLHAVVVQHVHRPRLLHLHSESDQLEALSLRVLVGGKVRV